MRALLAALLLIPGLAAAAEAPSFQLFPLKGLFYTQQADGAIDDDFLQALGDADKAYFQERFRSRFPTAATTISEANRRRTFAVSLQVARATRFTVAKANGTTDLYLPVTASTYFTNIVTGEVLFASTRTLYKIATVTAAQAAAGSATVRRLFAEAFHQVVDDLVEDAGQRFRPTEVTATVRKAWNGLYVLGGGREQGLSRDDSLLDAAGNELRILSAGPTYAVAKLELGTAAVGAVFTKPTCRTLAEIRKPRVLPIVESAPAGFAEETIVQLFSDALGAKAPVSLVPVNRTFAAVLAAVGSQTALSQEKLRQRELPSHFIRLHVQEPIVYEAPTNLAYKTRRVTQTIAYAEIVDQVGRVLFAARGRDRIEDEITDGQAIDVASRKEIGVKNALLDLSYRIASELRFESGALTVSTGGTSFSLKDDRGLLTPSAPVRVYRSIGKVDDLGEVWVPAWDAEVTAIGEGVASLQASLPLIDGVPAPAEGDRVFVEGVRPGRATRFRFGACGEADHRGDVTIDDFEGLALNVLLSRYTVPLYARGLGARVEALVRGGSGFKADARLREPPIDYCVQAAYRVVPQPAKCTEGACADVSVLRLGYRVRRPGADGKVLAQAGMESTMTGTTLPDATSGGARAAALEADLLDEVVKVALVAATQLGDQKL